MARIMVLGDLHLPYTLWPAVEAAALFARQYKPDLIIQVGDLIDGKAWSRYPKDPDDCPQTEWDATEIAVHRLHKLFPEMVILSGNHDRRIMHKAAEASIPSQLVKTLEEIFPYKQWIWHVGGKPFQIHDTVFIHGDETLGNAWQKAQRMGKNVVQGHDHQAYLNYINTFDTSVYGMSVGTFLDGKSAAARYAARNPFRCWLGWATITNGVPALHPYHEKKGGYSEETSTK